MHLLVCRVPRQECGVQKCPEGVWERCEEMPSVPRGELHPLSCFLPYSAPPKHLTEDQAAGEGPLRSSFEQSQQEAGTGSHKARV